MLATKTTLAIFEEHFFRDNRWSLLVTHFKSMLFCFFYMNRGEVVTFSFWNQLSPPVLLVLNKVLLRIDSRHFSRAYSSPVVFKPRRSHDPKSSSPSLCRRNLPLGRLPYPCCVPRNVSSSVMTNSCFFLQLISPIAQTRDPITYRLRKKDNGTVHIHLVHWIKDMTHAARAL